MPRDNSIQKVLVIGSGPIVIGQAAEFDYAGAQACRVLRQEGIRTVLVNSNPATIMTDKLLADVIYLEPLTQETLRRIIEKERPDGLLAGLGGQTGLTLAMQLGRSGVLEHYGVRLLGSDLEAIERAEDRERAADGPFCNCHNGSRSTPHCRADRISGHREACLYARRQRRRDCPESESASGHRAERA